MGEEVAVSTQPSNRFPLACAVCILVLLVAGDVLFICPYTLQSECGEESVCRGGITYCEGMIHTRFFAMETRLFRCINLIVMMILWIMALLGIYPKLSDGDKPFFRSMGAMILTMGYTQLSIVLDLAYNLSGVHTYRVQDVEFTQFTLRTPVMVLVIIIALLLALTVGDLLTS